VETWELHKLATVGVRRYALSTLGAAAALGAVHLLSRPLWPCVASLAAVCAGAAGLFVYASERGVELRAPFTCASVLTVGACVAGGVAAALAGGFDGPLGFGLVPIVFAWPVFMPGGPTRALPAAAGGLAVHVIVVLALHGGGGPAMPVMLVLGAACAVATAHQAERWRQLAGLWSPRDALTQTLSRTFFHERLMKLCAQRQRSLAPVTVVMLDVDRFRWLNDDHGRQAGDEVLELLATGIKADIRAGDFVGRSGGDEFVVVLDECEGQGAVQLLERVRQRLERPMSLGGAEVRISFSAGIVSREPGEVLEADGLVREARRALSRSKQSALNATSLHGHKVNRARQLPRRERRQLSGA
jgi:diguanylate cyclase (GGDEF)-like protein